MRLTRKRIQLARKRFSKGVPILTMAVQHSDTLMVEALRRLSWDNVRIFLAVVSAGSFKAAAKTLNLSTNTVRNHISRLEDVVETPLLNRTPQGVELTPAGRRLSEIAREMAAASRSIATQPAQEGELSPKVNLTVTEGVGTFWIIPRLAQFAQSNPEILIALDCTMTPKLTFAESNTVAVQLAKPTDPDAVCVHLGTLHLMPFAAPSYIEKRGMPANLLDVRNHRLILQTGQQINEGVFPALFGDSPPPGLVALETASSAAHYWAIAQGMGIGVLPTYARAITRNIVPVDVDLILRRDLWLSYPLGAKENRAVAKVIEWMRRSFDHTLYPWFGHEFVHPNTFEAEFEGTNVVRMFAGFMDLPIQISSGQ